MSFTIALAIIAYLIIGCFIAGFANLDPLTSQEFMPFMGMLLLWPTLVVVTICFVVFGGVIYLGRKVGARYLGPFRKFMGKIMDPEVN